MPGSPEAGREFLIRACGILIHEDSVLMQQAEASSGGATYALPGGHLEFGETLAACLAREMFEEAGLNVEAEKLVYVHENFYATKGIRTHEIGFYFLVDLNSEFPRPDPAGYIPSREPHIRMRLLPLTQLSAFPVMPEFLRKELPAAVADQFSSPTRHLIAWED